MAFTAGTIRDELLRRVRAYGGISFTDAWARTILSLCERTVNAAIRSVLATTDVTTTAYQTLYFLRTSFTAALYDAIDIVGVTCTDASGPYEIRKCTLQDLFAYSSTWFRDSSASRYRFWCQIGKDLLILYPAATAGRTVSVTYSKQTTALSADGTTMDLPKEDVWMALDLAEIVLFAALRLTPIAQAKTQAMTSKLVAESESK